MCIHVYIPGRRKKREEGEIPILCFSYKGTTPDCLEGLETSTSDWNRGQVNNVVLNQLKNADGKVININHTFTVHVFYFSMNLVQ